MSGPAKPKNMCAKSRPRNNPYEVWQTRDGRWTWNVLKKWQANDDKPYARWFCDVKSPFTPDGEMGDVYVADIKREAVKVGVCTCEDCAVCHGKRVICGACRMCSRCHNHREDCKGCPSIR